MKGTVKKMKGTVKLIKATVKKNERDCKGKWKGL